MVGKKLSLLGLKAPKKYTLSAFCKNKNNYHLILLLSSKAFLAIPTLFMSKKVLTNFTPLFSILSLKPNLVKLRLTNVNNILILLASKVV